MGSLGSYQWGYSGVISKATIVITVITCLEVPWVDKSGGHGAPLRVPLKGSIGLLGLRGRYKWGYK